MKRLAKPLLAAIVSAAWLVTPAVADPHGHGHGHNPHDEGRHDNGLHRGWDRHQYNGYAYHGVWHYGPPPEALDGVEYGYRVWRRGDHLPDYYLNSYEVIDYG